jgi:hypothetical protein
MMSELTFDALASRLHKGAQGATRAASLATSAKNKKGSAKKQARKKCRQQGAQCEALAAASCQGDQVCLDSKKPCCLFASTCNFDAFLVCFSA